MTRIGKQHGSGARWAVFVLTVVLAGCAGTQNRETDPINDPWEGYNRKVHWFNMQVDKIVKPIAIGYDRIMPDPVQRGIGNFFRNLNYPVTAINQILQGKFRDFGTSTGRFLVNTIFGLLGVFDVATKAGIPQYNEDFGQTFAVWGWADSRYFVLPFLGPSTPRDTLGRGAYIYTHPLPYLAREEDVYWPIVLDLIHGRAALLGQDEQIEEAYDPYTFVRDAWLQNRTYLIHDGEPPEPDYDAYLEGLDE